MSSSAAKECITQNGRRRLKATRLNLDDTVGGDERRNWATIFLLGIIGMQFICTVVGFVLFAYFVDVKFRNDHERSARELQDYHKQLDNQLSDLQENIDNLNNLNKQFVNLNSEIETLKQNNINRGPIRNLQQLGLHESKSEKYIAVDVESIDEFPSIERVDETILGDEDDENEDDEDEYDSETVTNTQITDSSDRNWVGQIKSNLHQKPRVKFPVQKTSTVTDTFGDNDTSKNLPPSHILPVHAVQPHNRTENEDEPEKVVSNESINRRLEKESNKFGLAPDSNLNRSDVKSSDEKVKIHPNNHNTESENEHRGKIERNHSRLKRSGFPSLDSAQSLLNSVTPTSFSVTIDGPKGTYQFPSNSWPAAHFDSHTPSKLTEPKVPNDCPIEIKNNNRKWKPTITPGGEHFDLKNNEYITIKEEGLYFVYSQIIFYRDKSMFGYSIENQQQRILQCSIHSPVNRTNSGSGTSCFTAGLVYLNQNDVLKLELHNDSGKCVQWGPKKSFIGLFKLPTNSN